MVEERIFGPAPRVRRVALAAQAGAAACALGVLLFLAAARPPGWTHLLAGVVGLAAVALAVAVRVASSLAYVIHPNYLAVRVAGRDREVFRWDGLIAVAEVGPPPGTLRLFRADEEIQVALADRADPDGLRAAVLRELDAEWSNRTARTPDQTFYYPRILLQEVEAGEEACDAAKHQDLLALAGVQVLEDRLRLLGRDGESTEIAWPEIAAVDSGECLTVRARDGRSFRFHPELSFYGKFRAALEEERGRAAAPGGPA